MIGCPNYFKHLLIDDVVNWKDDFRIIVMNHDFEFDRKSTSFIHQLLPFQHTTPYLKKHICIKAPDVNADAKLEWHISATWVPEDEEKVLKETKRRMLPKVPKFGMAIYNNSSKEKYIMYTGIVDLSSPHQYGSALTVNIHIEHPF